jgi:hypothetical protein
MKRISLCLIIIFLALVSSRSWAVGLHPKSEVNWLAPGSTLPLSVEKKRQFRFVSRTCESGCDEEYESSDGQRVSLVHACFSGSAESVPRDMQSSMEDGRVLKREWRRTRRGRRGQRTVVLYPKDDTGGTPAAIFWYRRGETCFWYIQAGSLELALQFEQSNAAAKALLAVD